jgi:hypothetical protein
MINHKLLISGNYVEKLALLVAKISQDFNKMSTSENFFFPLLARVSADYSDHHLISVMNLSIVL